MPARRLIPAALLLLAVAGCERPAPMTRARAVVVADNVQRAEGLDWGDPVEVLAPGAAEADGRRWWQLRYRPGPDGAGRLILVDQDSGWGRLPPAERVPRAALRPAGPATAPAQAAPVLADGPWILVLDAHADGSPERDGALARAATALNGQAAAAGLQPAFSVHRDRTGRTALVYGWQGDRGIVQDRAVADWVRGRTAYARAAWVDLLAP